MQYYQVSFSAFESVEETTLSLGERHCNSCKRSTMFSVSTDQKKNQKFSSVSGEFKPRAASSPLKSQGINSSQMGEMKKSKKTSPCELDKFSANNIINVILPSTASSSFTDEEDLLNSLHSFLAFYLWPQLRLPLLPSSFHHLPDLAGLQPWNDRVLCITSFFQTG